MRLRSGGGEFNRPCAIGAAGRGTGTGQRAGGVRTRNGRGRRRSPCAPGLPLAGIPPVRLAACRPRTRRGGWGGGAKDFCGNRPAPQAGSNICRHGACRSHGAGANKIVAPRGVGRVRGDPQARAYSRAGSGRKEGQGACPPHSPGRLEHGEEQEDMQPIRHSAPRGSRRMRQEELSMQGMILHAR